MARKILGIVAVLIVWGIGSPAPLFAQEQVTVSEGFANILEQGIIFANICPSPALSDDVTSGTTATDSCQCRAQGICSLSQVIQLFVNIIILLLGISGSVALAMFVYAGWLWVFAQGRPGEIQEGKDTMKNAAIGLAIVFGAYAAINFVIAFLGGITPEATLEDTINALPATQEGSATVDFNAEQVIDSTTE